MQLSPEIFRAQGNNQNQSLAGKLSLYMLRVRFFVSEKSTKIRRGSSLVVQWLRGHHLTLFSLPTHSPRAVPQGSPLVLNFALPSLTSALSLFLMQLSPTCYPLTPPVVGLLLPKSSRYATLQTPLSMGFPRQEYLSGLPFPTPEIKLMSLVSPTLAGGFFTTEPVRKPFIY